MGGGSVCWGLRVVGGEKRDWTAATALRRKFTVDLLLPAMGKSVHISYHGSRAVLFYALASVLMMRLSTSIEFASSASEESMSLRLLEVFSMLLLSSSTSFL